MLKITPEQKELIERLKTDRCTNTTILNILIENIAPLLDSFKKTEITTLLNSEKVLPKKLQNKAFQAWCRDNKIQLEKLQETNSEMVETPHAKKEENKRSIGERLKEVVDNSELLRIENQKLKDEIERLKKSGANSSSDLSPDSKENIPKNTTEKKEDITVNKSSSKEYDIDNAHKKVNRDRYNTATMNDEDGE